MIVDWKNVEDEPLPEIGRFFVWLEEPYLHCTHMQVMVRYSNLSYIGGSFAFDCSKVLYWSYMPEGPNGLKDKEWT
jgi:hypothetical protein